MYAMRHGIVFVSLGFFGLAAMDLSAMDLSAINFYFYIFLYMYVNEMNTGKVLNTRKIIINTGQIIYDGNIRESSDSRIPGAHGLLCTRGLCPKSL